MHIQTKVNKLSKILYPKTKFIVREILWDILYRKNYNINC